MSKDKAFTGSKTIKQNTKMKKRILGAVIIAAMAFAASWNFNQSKNDTVLSDLTSANVEALARGEGEGNFPACQKKKGSGDRATIPFCVNGKCKQTYENKGSLDVNYCS